MHATQDADGAGRGACLAAAVQAQDFPGQPITMVVTAPAGGAADVMARTKPDGYTLLLAHATPIDDAPFWFSKVAHDVKRELTPITEVTAFTLVYAVHPSVPATDLKSFIAWAHDHQDKVSHGSFGVGSPSHLANAFFDRQNGLNMAHAVDKGEAPLVQDLLDGHVAAGITTFGTIRPQGNRSGTMLPGAPCTQGRGWRGGKALRAAAVAEAQRAQSRTMTSMGAQGRIGRVGRPGWWHRAAAAMAVLSLLAGCATKSDGVVPLSTDPARYADWDCSRLHDEIDAVQQRAADVAYAVDSRVGNNMIALGLGVTVFWPALLAMRPDGLEAEQLAELKGRYEALRTVVARQSCPPPPEAMAAQRQAALPVALGERLVYEERATATAPAHLLGMQVTALRRDQIEFRVDRDGQAYAEPWRQDLAGNTVLPGRAPLLGWRRLLKTELVLGQVLAGDLAAADNTRPSARVRGQVVATGPQTIAGRDFDVAVIELFGEAPLRSEGPGGMDVGSTRLDGVMAVDRRNGLLLRLELHCGNADFALRRRLVRVESPPRP